jgi:hypothetical protein
MSGDDLTAYNVGLSGLSSSSPPAEKAAAREDQAGQERAPRGGARGSGRQKGLAGSSRAIFCAAF